MKQTAMLFFLLAGASFAWGQQSVHLGEAAKKGRLQAVNRSLQPSTNEGPEAVTLSEASGEGLAWIKGASFTTGTLEIDLKGKDEYQKSFLGIAFHGSNDSTYEAVYFRPFNFRTPDSVRHIHAVQYISHPQFPWKRLREEFNGQYEKAVRPEPDPDQWFHARIEVKEKTVAVFVNNALSPSLEVPLLHPSSGKRIGLWVGDGAGGSFRNLQVRKESRK
ncbi:family 16 glycoside hydrolase [Paraflavisolibacter sp. H34]|uniref:family 16 glycoside hydrolase n=1 Tax=Huijunlia imazamoxiresistens TaxID=3127457 RepID=UPI00301AFDA9